MSFHSQLFATVDQETYSAKLATDSKSKKIYVNPNTAKVQSDTRIL